MQFPLSIDNIEKNISDKKCIRCGNSLVNSRYLCDLKNKEHRSCFSMYAFRFGSLKVDNDNVRRWNNVTMFRQLLKESGKKLGFSLFDNYLDWVGGKRNNDSSFNDEVNMEKILQWYSQLNIIEMKNNATGEEETETEETEQVAETKKISLRNRSSIKKPSKYKNVILYKGDFDNIISQD